MKIKEHFEFLDMVKGFHVDEKASLFDKEPDYQIVDAKSKNSYIVTSWTHGKEPRNIYIVNKAGNKWICNCPTRTPYCKHIDMVKQWLKDGKPSEWDIDADELKKLLRNKGVSV